MPKKSNNNLCAFFKLNSFERLRFPSRNRSIEFEREGAWYRLDRQGVDERSPSGRFIYIFPRARTRVNRPSYPPPSSPSSPPCTCTERVGRIRDARGSEGASNGAGRRGGAAGGRAEEEEGEGRQGGSGGRRAVSWRLRTVS